MIQSAWINLDCLYIQNLIIFYKADFMTEFQEC